MSVLTLEERAGIALEALAQHLWVRMRDSWGTSTNETEFLRLLRTNLETMKPWLVEVFEAARRTK